MTVINYDGQKLPAAVCDRCGGKVYPPSLLEAHQARHMIMWEEKRSPGPNPYVGKRKPGRPRKNMSSTGVEKTDNVIQTYGRR